MGAVLGVIRKQDGRDAARRASDLRELLSLLPIALAYYAGALLLPRVGSPWLGALLWAAFGALLFALLLLASRVPGRILRRPALSVTMPASYIFLMTVVLCPQRLFPERLWGDQGLAVLVESVVGGGILALAHWLTLLFRRRRERLRAT